MQKLLTIVILFSVLACNKKTDKNLELMQDEVMALHDEVMPKMGDIMSLKEQLNNNLAGIDSTKAGFKEKKAVSDTLKSKLAESDDQMMNWMNEYNVDTLRNINEDEGLKYLKAEKEKLTTIKLSTNKNIDAAKLFLKK
jgi:hypothetical protein